MQYAFGQFYEPFAWLIRGLVEYGWEDISLSPSKYPSQSGKGFDCNPLVRSGGKDGLRLSVMAIDENGVWDENEKICRFNVKLGADKWGRPAFFIRSVDTGFQATYPFDANNPLYAAGYITQGVGNHVPIHLHNKRKGAQVTQSQINELRDINGQDCSQALIQFLWQRISYKRSMDMAIAEGLWVSTYSQRQPASVEQKPPEPTVQPIPNTPEQHSEFEEQRPLQPRITSGAGQGFRIAGIGHKGQTQVATSASAQAIDKANAPGKALAFMSIMGFLFGGLALINGILTQLMIMNNDTVRSVQSYKPIVMSSLLLGILALVGGFFALKGAKDYQRLNRSNSAIFSIAYAGLLPLCWPLGLPIAIWALIARKKSGV